MTRSLLVYVACVICGWALYEQALYLQSYFANPSNQVRAENLEGVFLAGVLSSVAWLPLLLAVFRFNVVLPPLQRYLSLTASGAVLLVLLASIVIGFVT